MARRLLVVVGAYLIGKEKVFKALAKSLNSKIYADSAKRRVLQCLEDPELAQMLTVKPEEANVHVVGMGKLTKAFLSELLETHSRSFSHILAVRPTGWTFRNSSGTSKAGAEPRAGAGAGAASTDRGFTLRSLVPQYLTKTITLVPLPYSEHSSFAELEAFVKSLDVRRIIPTCVLGQ
eukprot:jgi/Hompol1/6639/HPOL_003941-RA